MAPERPGLMRPPSTAYAASSIQAQANPAKRAAMPQSQESLSRRRPAAPRQTSSSSPILKLNSDLPPVGKYHPLNYCSPNNTRPSSSHSSQNTTPNAPSPTAVPAGSYLHPISPRSHVRTLSHVERRLHDYYRDRAVNATRQTFTVTTPGEKPASPKLAPAISPGAVTPLELENANCYFATAKPRSGTSSPRHNRNKSRDSPTSYGAWTDGFSFEGSGPLSPRTPPAAIDSF